MIQTLQCFGASIGNGNRALVIENDSNDEALRQSFSRARGVTCVFIDIDTDGVPVLDYFYPHARSPLCLHATLAVAHVLLARAPSLAAIDVKTAIHGQRLTLSQRGDDYFAGLARREATAVTIAPGLPAILLNRPTLALVSAPVVASVGSPKLLLEVADSATLHQLAPDLAAITAWGQAHGINGCYVYCRRADGGYEGRNFNHPATSQEDSATGVAAGALSVHLGHGLNLFQGAGLGNPCLMRTLIEGDQVLVGGAVAVITDA